MRTHGVGPGDTVAILGATSARWCVVALAVLQLGANCLAIDARLPASERDALLRTLRCAGIWYDLGGGEPLAADLDVPQWELDPALVDAAWERPPRTFVPDADERPGNEAAVFVTTQGMMGPVRPFRLSQALVAARALAVADVLRLHGDQEIFCCTSIGHAWTQVMLWAAIVAGAPVTCGSGLDLDALEAVAPQLLLATPDQLERLRRNWENELWTGALARLEFRTGSRPKVVERAVQGAATLRHKTRLGGNLLAIVAAPARLRPHTANAWRTLAQVLESYGQTELGGVVSLDSRLGERPGTAGRLLRGLDGHVAPDGSLEVEAELMASAVGETDAARKPWNTGDLARLQHGFVSIEGRRGDRHELPSPLRRLEDALAALPLVRRVAIATTEEGVTALLQLDDHHARRLAAAERWHPRDLVDLVQHPQILRLVRDGVLRAASLVDVDVDAVALARSPWTVEAGLLSVLGEPRLAALEARFPHDFVLVPHFSGTASGARRARFETP